MLPKILSQSMKIYLKYWYLTIPWTDWTHEAPTKWDTSKQTHPESKILNWLYWRKQTSESETYQRNIHKHNNDHICNALSERTLDKYLTKLCSEALWVFARYYAFMCTQRCWWKMCQTSMSLHKVHQEVKTVSDKRGLNFHRDCHIPEAKCPSLSIAQKLSSVV